LLFLKERAAAASSTTIEAEDCNENETKGEEVDNCSNKKILPLFLIYLYLVITDIHAQYFTSFGATTLHYWKYADMSVALNHVL
jgi:hypothetical protein